MFRPESSPRGAQWSEEREQILLSDVAFFRRLSVRDMDTIRPRIARFIEEKEIVGFGIEVDDRVRVLVAAAACRLALNLPGETFSRLRRVEVFPTSFEDRYGDELQGRAEVHCVSLAFDSLEAGLRGDLGQNVGYHEFAHVLDASDGISDGVPPLLMNPALHRVWTRVMSAELARLRDTSEAAPPTVLDANAAKDEAELFAYATEAFFETPAQLHAAHPELYALLATYYAQDPLKSAAR